MCFPHLSDLVGQQRPVRPIERQQRHQKVGCAAVGHRGLTRVCRQKKRPEHEVAGTLVRDRWRLGAVCDRLLDEHFPLAGGDDLDTMHPRPHRHGPSAGIESEGVDEQLAGVAIWADNLHREVRVAPVGCAFPFVAPADSNISGQQFANNFSGVVLVPWTGPVQDATRDLSLRVSSERWNCGGRPRVGLSINRSETPSTESCGAV